MLRLDEGWTFGVKDAGYYQPLGILYVATYLKHKRPDVDVKVIDAASPDMPYDELALEIKAYAPDVIGISTYTPTFIDTLKIAGIAKKINPSVHINLGGHHLDHFSKETLTHDTIDSVIIGEGEVSFTRLIEHLLTNRPVESVPGVFTQKNIEAVDHFEKKDHFMNRIDELPFPDRGLVAAHDYYNVLTLNKKMTTIISSRGCPYNCSFCSQGREPYRQRSSVNVVDEIAACLKAGYTDFFFSEDTFNISKKKVVEFCQEIFKRDLKFSWCCKARIHGMDHETLAYMKAAGCYLINFGIETGSDEGLKAIRKGTSIREIRQVTRWCKQLGIKVMSYFIIGHPFERSKKDVNKNLDFLISLDTEFCHIGVLTPIPYTELFDGAEAKGIVSYTPWKNFVLTGESFTIKNWDEHLTMSELSRLKMKGLLKFYFRPSYLMWQLVNNAHPKEIAYKAKVALNMIRGFLNTYRPV